MTDTLLSRVLADGSLRALEAIDEAPLDALEHLIAEGPAAGLHPERMRVARVRRAHLTHVMQPHPFPTDKAALLQRIAEAFPAKLEALKARYNRVSIDWPSIEAARTALDPGPCDVVRAGALIQVERRIRLNGTTEYRPMDQQLLFVTDVLQRCGPTLLDDPEVRILPIAEGTPGKLWRGFKGKGVEAVWSRPRPSLRAQHMRAGRHPDRQEPGPELMGEETRTIIAIA